MIRCDLFCLIFAGSFLIYLCVASPTRYEQPQQSTSNRQPPQQPAYHNNERGQNTELFGFPAEASVIESKQNARNRTPVFIPDQCGENEILYPGDQEHDWVCDCKPTFVYDPDNRKCHEMFTQGYCQPGYMISLPLNETEARCVLNDCYVSGRPYVKFDGECVELNTYHRTCKAGEIQRIVGVDEKTHQLSCMDISVVQVKNVTKNGTAEVPSEV